MEPKTIAVPGSTRGRPPSDQAALRRRRFLLIAAGLSIALHFAAALLIVVLPRVLPRDTAPQEPGTVELLMVEQKGATPSQAGPPETERTPPAKSSETAKQEPQKAEPPPQAVTPAPTPPPTPEADEPAPPPTPPVPAPARAERPQSASPATPLNPTPPAPKPAAEPSPAGPVFDLAGTESESNAYVLGAQVVPASPDNRFRNRPPIFPHEAELRGEHGTVVVVIHVSEAGVATGADVMESSGVEALDQAAVDAVRKWHFRPAMREGRSIPFDMPFRFIFQAD